jgi:N-acetylglucosamine-6-sulfatase
MKTQPTITADAAAVITGAFKNRWRTLMSVDDVIFDVITTCEDLGVADNTYFFYSSDHGFQLGENNIPMDKRHVYDWDTRIHLLARGPGIAAGSLWHQPATQVDMAPTFLGLAGLAKPATFDGKSLVPILVTHPPTVGAGALPPATSMHLASLGDAGRYKAEWRDSVFIEYYFVNDNIKCTSKCTAATKQYPEVDANCGDLTFDKNGECWSGPAHPGHSCGAGCCSADCYPTESLANNFIALRSMTGSDFGNTLYAIYQNGSQYEANIDFSRVDFAEQYNATVDPWMTTNLCAGKMQGCNSNMEVELRKWFGCAGDSCP